MAKHRAPRLELRHGNFLNLTPQMRQSIDLLQMNRQELEVFIEAKVLENPLLEAEETEETEAAEEAETEPDDHNLDEHNSDTETAETTETADEPPDPDDLDCEPELMYDDALSYQNQGQKSALGPTDILEQTEREPLSLRDHLQKQIYETFLSGKERQAALRLADELNAHGWLARPFATLQEEICHDLDLEPAFLNEVWEKMKQFDPTGLFAEDLSMCLALQLAEKNRLDPPMRALLDHLPLLAQKDDKALLKICRVSMEDLRDMVKEIRNLNPSPTSSFQSDLLQPLIPEAFVRRLDDGNFSIELNDAGARRFRLHRDTPNLFRKGLILGREEDRLYLTERKKEANFLISALEKRRRTFLKVSRAIFKTQESFLRYGVEHLKPMVMRDIAKDTDFNESTISRVCSGKYVSTPHGIFELKFFFTSALRNAQDEHTISARVVKHQIKTLIQQEQNGRPLSDQKIADELKREGIKLARRTVAKYRESMKIPASSFRRREHLSAF